MALPKRKAHITKKNTLSPSQGIPRIVGLMLLCVCLPPKKKKSSRWQTCAESVTLRYTSTTLEFINTELSTAAGDVMWKFSSLFSRPNPPSRCVFTSLIGCCCRQPRSPATLPGEFDAACFQLPSKKIPPHRSVFRTQTLLRAREFQRCRHPTSPPAQSKFAFQLVCIPAFCEQKHV